jgi:hypothetical protein
MVLSDSNRGYAPRPPRAARETLDRDVLDFVSRSPDLKEFAFLLADRGCVYVGQLVQLEEDQALRVARGDKRLVWEMREKLAYSGLAFGLNADDWEPPTVTEAIEEA